LRSSDTSDCDCPVSAAIVCWVGEWTGGGRLFGYSRDGIAVVPAEAEAVRDGVRRVLAGEPVYAITKSCRRRCPRCAAGRGIGAGAFSLRSA
jgi:hypothetical protein